MRRGLVAFMIVFLALPLLTLFAVPALGASSMWAFIGLALMITGVVLAPGFFEF